MEKSASGTGPAMLEQHPIALSVVPGTMLPFEYEALCADLKKRGQLHEIVTYEGKILDGMHRYRGCLHEGITPQFKPYTGDDPTGLTIALNVLRRKLGTTQRALAGARLNLEFKISQDEASKRVGVSKLHINLVVQAINSKNARVLKLLEDADLTREKLYEELCDCGIVRGHVGPTPAVPSKLSAAGATLGLDSLFANRAVDEDDMLSEHADAELEEALGAPPSANGKMLAVSANKRPQEEDPLVGTRPSHPERFNRETVAYKLAQQFKGLAEADRISFMQLSWHMIRPLLSAAGLSLTAATPAEAPSVPAVRTPPGKATSAQAAAALAAQTVAKASKGAAKGKATKAA